MTSNLDFPMPDVAAANLRHDQEHGDPFAMTSVKCGWRESALMRRGELTNRTIAKYERLGFYSAAFRDARRALQDRKAKKRVRQGNFLIAEDGRPIYNPQ